ncbi:MAG: flavodoxin domain-containing protein [Chloroflexota bacterium]
MTGITLTRRRFLVGAGLTVGASSLALAGLGAAETAVTLPEITLGENTMSSKILVAYASRAGSTVGVAEAIGQTLAAGGAQVDVRPMTEVADLAPYDAVVAGSAIRGGKWLPEALQFLRTHQAALARKPLATFLVCITMGSTNPAYHQGVPAWMAPVRALVRPVSEGLFAGNLDFSKLPLSLDALMLRAAVAFGALPQGDHRDWEAIRAWSTTIRPLLLR